MEFYAGLDVSLEATSVCGGEWRGQGRPGRKTAVRPGRDRAVPGRMGVSVHLKRVGLEAFPFSSLLYAALDDKGLTVICIKTRQTKAALNAMVTKTARNDARGIAQLMRIGWFRSIHVKLREAQTLRLLLAGRKVLLGKVLDIEHDPRPDPAVWPEGPPGLHRQVRCACSRTGVAGLAELALAAACNDKAVRRMMTVPGVIMALTFRATVDDLTRFRKSVTVGAHFGLTPRRYQSGETDWSGHTPNVETR